MIGTAMNSKPTSQNPTSLPSSARSIGEPLK
jgi:hypothetical protein